MYNLPANIENISDKELAILSGQSQEREGNGLPTLRVNYEDEDNDGNKVPRGEWVAYRQDGVRVYAPVAKFRPILATYQYNHYDADKQEMVSKSVYFRGFKDDCPDSAGGFRCGKVKKKDLEKLSAAEQAIQKEIRLSRVFFGELTMEGKDQKGNPQTIENMPCMFYARGSHFMPMTNFIDGLGGTPMQSITIDMALKREKNGGVVYWEVVPTRGVDVSVNAETFSLMKDFGATIAAENDEIMSKHKSIRAKGVSPRMSAVEEAIDKASPKLELDDDEIPF